MSDVIAEPAYPHKEPKDPLGDGVSLVEYIQHTGSDKMIVHAARVSYAADTRDVEFNPKDRKLLKFLLENNHGTPLEHNLITFKVRAPLYVIQEMLRHRIGTSFNQESYRYIEPGAKSDVICRFYVPQKFRKQDQKNKQSSTGEFDEVSNDLVTFFYRQQCENAFKTYESLLENGVARELARGVLPHSTYSSLYFTCNIRSLVHFLGLRLDTRAQWEIQMYARAMADIAKSLFPETFDVLKELGKLEVPNG